tara:strand:- start:267 stop:404 length:138 start_codon:yes stop_codon:yes gene_type:complete
MKVHESQSIMGASKNAFLQKDEENLIRATTQKVKKVKANETWQLE